MSSINPLDRLSLCHFTFADGRRCRTPRLSTHPTFCHYHAQLAAQSKLTTQLANDISQLLANPNLSPNQLSAALARLIPAVLHGHLKIRTARTVAYLLQTLLQTIRLSQLPYLQSSCASPESNPAQSPAAPPNATSATDRHVAAGLPRRSAATPPQAPAPAESGPAQRGRASGHDVGSPNSPSVNAALSVARRLFPPHPLTPASATLTKNEGSLAPSPVAGAPTPSQH